jgi:hypothetical protein
VCRRPCRTPSPVTGLSCHHCVAVRTTGGLDSLGAVEYVNLVGRRLNLQLPSTLIFDYPTVSSVSGYLSTKLAARQPSASAPVAAAVVVRVQKQLAAPAAASMSAPALTIGIKGTLLWPLMGGQPASSSIVGINLPQQDAIQAIPASRWNPDETRGLPADITSAVAATRFGAFLQGVDQFDPAAFGLSGSEALAMDPQHRVLLASAAQLLNSPGAYAAAGDSRKSLQQAVSDTGVFVGISWTEYHALSKACGQPVGANTAQGAVLSVACGRCKSASSVMHVYCSC